MLAEELSLFTSTHLEIEPMESIGLLHKRPHGGALGIRMLPDLSGHSVEIHCVYSSTVDDQKQ